MTMMIKSINIIQAIYLNHMIKELSLICLTAMSMNLNNYQVLCDNSDLIINESKNHKIDYIDFISIMWNESRFINNITSNSGSCGIAQINPKYTEFWNKKNKNRKLEHKRVCSILSDEKINIKIAIEKYGYWYHKYSRKNNDIAFCAYNYGFRCKNEKGKKIPDSVIKYVSNIKTFSRRFRRRLRFMQQQKKYKVHINKN